MADSSYKMYITTMSSVMRSIDPNVKDTTITAWMRDIAEAFPFYKHTNPAVMAIAKYMLQSGSDTFDAVQARELVAKTPFNYVGWKSTQPVIKDVLRYYIRLQTPLVTPE